MSHVSIFMNRLSGLLIMVENIYGHTVASRLQKLISRSTIRKWLLTHLAEKVRKIKKCIVSG